MNDVRYIGLQVATVGRPDAQAKAARAAAWRALRGTPGHRESPRLQLDLVKFETGDILPFELAIGCQMPCDPPSRAPDDRCRDG